MPMNVPPPPVAIGDLGNSFASSSSNSSRSSSAREPSIAEQLRLRNPQLYERMQRRKETVSAPVAVARASQLQQDRRAKAEQDRVQQIVPQPTQNPTLARLSHGERARVPAAEMKERSRRLYDKLPEVVERKRQQDLMIQRLQRLQQLRENEKTRRGRPTGHPKEQ
ncbi:hypothetical protein ACHHYP_10015 [Achlya hypogyna]|uniref:Uncharacterized protein n=1 Tax=Achlya hypogyna TaxID=1202772 RepID=A0A1V9ZII3_ACHHY|nr:hypothetical protein ACHHYP_10015 [Achlya hypogyna]